jgi:hypothetical protein
MYRAVGASKPAERRRRMRFRSIVCMSVRTAAAPSDSAAGRIEPAAMIVSPSVSRGLSVSSVSLAARCSAARTSIARQRREGGRRKRVLTVHGGGIGRDVLCGGADRTQDVCGLT